MSAPPLALRPVAPAEPPARCAICQSDLREGEQTGPCPECGAPFHGECWDEYGGCAVYGCALAPAPEAATPAPASVWGQEERDCPGCGRRVRMAARRCRHCGRELAPGGAPAPVASGPGLGVPVVLLVLAMLPTAPLALVAGGFWIGARRQLLRRGPPMPRVLALAGMVAAAAVTAVMIGGLVLHLAAGAGGRWAEP